MKWASSIAEGTELRDMVGRCAGDILEKLDNQEPDVVFVFVTPHFSEHYSRIPDLINEHLPSEHMIGCSAGGVIGGQREIEQRAGISITAAILPDVKVRPFMADTYNPPDDDASPERWKAWTGLDEFAGGPMVIVVDPFASASEDFLTGLDYAFPNSPKIGGLASGATQSKGNAVFLNGESISDGLAGLAFEGNIAVDTVVAQGCRPIGAPLTMTAVEQNLLFELDGKQALDVLKGVLDRLCDEDKKLARSALFLGVEVDPLAADAYSGCYLIRNIVGVDYHSGALAVGSFLEEGRMVQFHLRDAKASEQDLLQRLNRYAERGYPDDVAGGLMFSCLGRGKYLYGSEGYDSELFRSKIRNCPIGGFFCNGEIGPVGQSSYLHGYTSSFGLFRPIN